MDTTDEEASLAKDQETAQPLPRPKDAQRYVAAERTGTCSFVSSMVGPEDALIYAHSQRCSTCGLLERFRSKCCMEEFIGQNLPWIPLHGQWMQGGCSG
eukprot:g22694.t1